MPAHPHSRHRRKHALRLVGAVTGLLGLAVPATASAAVHVVRPGETLSEIAQRHGTTASSLARANGLARADLVIAGRTLTVPGAPTGASHRIAPGDTLSTIAARYGVSTAALAAANGISNRDVVVIGRSLAVPGGGAPASAPTATAGAHRVARGETLSHIALRYGVSTSALASANAITNPNLVVVGRTLSVPPGGGRASAPTATAGAPASAGRHTVRPGEALSTIAARYGVTSTALADANGIRNRNLVAAGTTLTVPGAAAAPSAAAGTGLPSRLRAHPSRLALMPTFRKWAANYGVPVDLLMAMTWLESGWQSTAVSSTGAVGIGQLMPATVEWMEDVIIREPLDVHDPDDNIRMSARYLRWLLDRTGSTRTSLAGYYQGLRSVLEIGLYDDTEAYVDGVMALRHRFG